MEKGSTIGIFWFQIYFKCKAILTIASSHDPYIIITMDECGPKFNSNHERIWVAGDLFLACIDACLYLQEQTTKLEAFKEDKINSNPKNILKWYQIYIQNGRKNPLSIIYILCLSILNHFGFRWETEDLRVKNISRELRNRRLESKKYIERNHCILWHRVGIQILEDNVIFLESCPLEDRYCDIKNWEEPKKWSPAPAAAIMGSSS